MENRQAPVPNERSKGSRRNSQNHEASQQDGGGAELDGRTGRSDLQSAVSRKVMLTTMQIMSWPRRLSADR